MALPSSCQSAVEYFSKVLQFLKHNQHLYNYPNTDVLIQNVLKKINITNLIEMNMFEKEFDINTVLELKSLFEEVENLTINHKRRYYDGVDTDYFGSVPLGVKKMHEINCLSQEINRHCQKIGCDTIVDLGCGLGYLDELLFKKYNYKILGLEHSKNFIKAAEKRQKSYHSESIDKVKYVEHFINDKSSVAIENLLNEHFPDSTKICIVGLHACADLTVHAINIFLKMDVAKCLVLMPCCYHKMTLKSNQYACEIRSDEESEHIDKKSETKEVAGNIKEAINSDEINVEVLDIKFDPVSNIELDKKCENINDTTSESRNRQKDRKIREAAQNCDEINVEEIQLKFNSLSTLDMCPINRLNKECEHINTKSQTKKETAVNIQAPINVGKINVEELKINSDSVSNVDLDKEYEDINDTKSESQNRQKDEKSGGAIQNSDEISVAVIEIESNSLSNLNASQANRLVEGYDEFNDTKSEIENSQNGGKIKKAVNTEEIKPEIEVNSTKQCQYFNNFPLSEALKSVYASNDGAKYLRIPFLRLASQPPTTDEDLKTLVFRLLARAVLQLYCHKNNQRMVKKKRRAIKLASQSRDFSKYLEDATQGYSLQCNKNTCSSFEEKFKACCNSEFNIQQLMSMWSDLWCDLTVKRAAILILLQRHLQPMFENLVLFDRIQFMKENGIEKCQFIKIVDDKVSPRCLALVTIK